MAELQSFSSIACLLDQTRISSLEVVLTISPLLLHLKSPSYKKEVLEDAARYVALLLAPAEGIGLQLGLFLALRAKKTCYTVLAHFRPF